LAVPYIIVTFDHEHFTETTIYNKL